VFVDRDERDERIELLEQEVRSLRAVAESTHRNTSWLFWLLIGVPAVMFGVYALAYLVNVIGSLLVDWF
jgi:hypothetical protein